MREGECGGIDPGTGAATLGGAETVPHPTGDHMLVTLRKTAGLVAATILALCAVGVAAPGAGTGQDGHQVVADHQGPAVVIP
ncbi:hypothetical protein GCM10010104_39290 [Streptomyces indiaensis]|uniref:Uncharacterized protein n=2 Tax=Streptomyces indiaensis TaxID=284033 RepID=A0ABN3DSB2_9ACTN